MKDPIKAHIQAVAGILQPRPKESEILHETTVDLHLENARLSAELRRAMRIIEKKNEIIATQAKELDETGN